MTGADPTNALAAEADVVLAVGTRLQDFTTGSWTVFRDEDLRLVSINVARHDAVKHLGTAVQGDARETLRELSALLGDWRTDDAWRGRAAEEQRARAAAIERRVAPGPDGEEPTYAQVIGAVNALAAPDDYVVAAAGGFPGELNVNWRSLGRSTFDCEYGYSCMGYEISGAWGARMARADGEVIVFVGDGSYLMLNSDLYSSVLTGDKLIVVVCDNGGFAVIDRLQRGMGGASFGNQLDSSRVAELVRVDFAQHAAAMGCETETVGTIGELEAAFERARSALRTTVISIRTQPDAWSDGGAFWEVGVPEVSDRESVRAARARIDEGKRAQRAGW